MVKNISNDVSLYTRFFLYKVERLLGVIPDKQFLKIMYRIRTKEHLNLGNPQGFCEKIQWIKLYDRKKEYVQWSDKIAAKEMAAKMMGKEHIIPTIGIYNSTKEIDISKLPNRFVIKCNHDSGGVEVCNDKSSFDFKRAFKVLEVRLHRNFYYHAREWGYKDIVPKLLIEENIADNKELYNYKFYCFNGEPKFLYVSLETIVDGKKLALLKYFDIDWNEMELRREDHPGIDKVIKKPANYDEMVELSKKFAKGIPFARVDFYDINNWIYFSEMTFYPGGGFSQFYPKKYEKIIGEWIELPQ